MLCDSDPFEFGFANAEKHFRRDNGRPVISAYETIHFGFADDKARAAAHAKVRAFLDKRKDAPKEEPKPDPAHAKLVEQLGSADFAAREAAEKKLKELGIRAEPALKAGLKSEDPEVRARAAQLLVTIRKDALDALVKTFDPAGTHEPDHPIWERYKAIAGTDGPARRLFAEMIRDPRLRLLDTAEANPGKAGELYEQHVKQIGANFQKGNEHRQKRGGLLVGNVIDLDDPTPKPIDVAIAFYLGTFPASANAFYDPDWERWVGYYGEEGTALFAGAAFYQGIECPNCSIRTDLDTAPAFRRLFAGWLAARRNPIAIAAGLVHARSRPVAEVLPIAQAVLADAKQLVKVRVEALPIVAARGEAKDEPGVVALLDDKTPITWCGYGPAQKEAQVQVRDVALAALLVMRGKDPGDFGFPGLEFHRAGALKKIPLYPHYLGFYDDATRAAAHKKARTWLDEQKK